MGGEVFSSTDRTKKFGVANYKKNYGMQDGGQIRS
jgi:hypothetical protein